MMIVIDSAAKQDNTNVKPKFHTQYLPEWEKKAVAQCKTFIFDSSGAKNEPFACCICFKNDGMYCWFCQRYNKQGNTNGKICLTNVFVKILSVSIKVL